MKISLLLEREPFEKILSQTLSNFFKKQNGGEYQVIWRNDKKGDWLINRHLNAIFFKEANKNVFSQIIREFSRSAKWWLRPFQKFYITLSKSRSAKKIFASASLDIIPQLNNQADILIIGGNHHLRILDYNHNQAVVIHKTGFNKQFLINEIKLRQENAYLPCPKIKKIADDNSWYLEELIQGTPLNRIANATLAENSLKLANKSLSKLYDNTKHQINLNSYLTEICEQQRRLIEENILIKEHLKAEIKKILHQLTKKIGYLSVLNQTITICQTHGDFQSANILVDNDKVWLIDWEYTEKRQIDFDNFVFRFQSRFPLNFHKRFEKAYHSRTTDKHAQLKLLLFLLEELAFRLREIDNNLFEKLDSGFISFNFELKKLSTCYENRD